MTDDDDPRCSICNQSAEYEVVDADPAKGNLACRGCVRFWPLSDFKSLKRD